MPAYYEITPVNASVVLEKGKGSASFTVRYVGTRRTEARATAVPMERTENHWLEVQPPSQRYIEPEQTQAYKVNVAVPAGTSPGRYGLRLDVLSVDNPDEEYVRGPLVTFQVEESEEPKQQQGFPWRWVILAAVLLALVVGGAAWWSNRSKEALVDVREEQATRDDEAVVVDPEGPVVEEPAEPVGPAGPVEPVEPVGPGEAVRP